MNELTGVFLLFHNWTRLGTGDLHSSPIFLSLLTCCFSARCLFQNPYQFQQSPSSKSGTLVLKQGNTLPWQITGVHFTNSTFLFTLLSRTTVVFAKSHQTEFLKLSTVSCKSIKNTWASCQSWILSYPHTPHAQGNDLKHFPFNYFVLIIFYLYSYFKSPTSPKMILTRVNCRSSPFISSAIFRQLSFYILWMSVSLSIFIRSINRHFESLCSSSSFSCAARDAYILNVYAIAYIKPVLKKFHFVK